MSSGFCAKNRLFAKFSAVGLQPVSYTHLYDKAHFSYLRSARRPLFPRGEQLFSVKIIVSAEEAVELLQRVDENRQFLVGKLQTDAAHEVGPVSYTHL